MNNRPELIEHLKEMLLKIDPKLPADISASSHFYHELNIDSLDLTEYVASVEQEYRIRISDEEWEQLSSINAVADYLSIQTIA